MKHQLGPRVVRAMLPALALAAVTCVSAAAAPDDVTATRTVPHFDRIRIDGVFETSIRAGRPAKITLRATPEMIRAITTTVDGDTLVVGMRDTAPHRDRATPQLTIDAPRVRGFENRGAGNATLADLRADDITIVNAGAGTVNAAGQAVREKVTLSGAGSIDVTGVDAGDVTVENDGVGSVRVRARGMLAMTLDGVGEIRYAGEPAHIEQAVHGIGRISRIDR